MDLFNCVWMFWNVSKRLFKRKRRKQSLNVQIFVSEEWFSKKHSDKCITQFSERYNNVMKPTSREVHVERKRVLGSCLFPKAFHIQLYFAFNNKIIRGILLSFSKRNYPSSTRNESSWYNKTACITWIARYARSFVVSATIILFELISIEVIKSYP